MSSDHSDTPAPSRQPTHKSTLRSSAKHANIGLESRPDALGVGGRGARLKTAIRARGGDDTGPALSATTMSIVGAIAATLVLVGGVVAWFLMGGDEGSDESRMIANVSAAPPAPGPPTPPSPPGAPVPAQTATNGPANGGAVSGDLTSGHTPTSPTNTAPARAAPPTTGNGNNYFPLPPVVQAGLTGSQLPAAGGNSIPALPTDAPVAAGDPFVQLPAELDLEFEANIAEESRCVLGPLAVPGQATWKPRLDSGAADLNGFEFQVGEAAQEGDTVRWPIHLRAPAGQDKTSDLLTESIDSAAPVAHLLANQDTLVLAIPADRRSPQVPQLRNCLLELRAGAFAHRMQLRQTQRTPSISLELTESNTTIDLDLDNPPRDDSLAFVLDGSQLPPNVVADPPSCEGRLREAVTLNLTDWPGAAIEVRIFRTGGDYSVKIKPTFEMLDKKKALTVENVTIGINSSEKTLAKNNKEYQEAERRLSEIPGEVSRVRSIQPKNLQEATMLGAAAENLLQEGRNLGAKMKRLAETGPPLQNAIVRLRELAQVLQKLQGKLKFTVRVVARASEGEVLLLTAET